MTLDDDDMQKIKHAEGFWRTWGNAILWITAALIATFLAWPQLATKAEVTQASKDAQRNVEKQLDEHKEAQRHELEEMKAELKAIRAGVDEVNRYLRDGRKR